MKMIAIKYCTLFLLIFSLAGLSAKPNKINDIYLIVYTTKSGHTGHVGMAIDNYRVVIRDTIINKITVSQYDTVKDNTLTYYDFWGPPTINWDQHDQDLPGRYYKLPRSSAEERLTPQYFLTKGLPHSYDYPCDALIRIGTTPAIDYRLKEIAEEVQKEKTSFNTRRYNCTDYILYCLNRLFNANLEAKEYIPFFWSSTPNKFYKVITTSLTVDIVKAAGPEVNSSFIKGRIINTVLLNQLINHEKSN